MESKGRKAAVPRSPSDERLATSNESSLRLAGVTRESVVDGPGLRTVVFVQGCPHRCPGCHNPETWDPEGGYATTVEELWQSIAHAPLTRGVTFSGGEPFAQAGPLAILAERIKERGWDLFVYSGYTWEELADMGKKEPAIARLLALTDILIDGPFLLAEKAPGLPFRGSRNQRLLDLRRSEAEGRPVLWEPSWGCL